MTNGIDMSKRIRLALQDIIEGLNWFSAYTILAWREIKVRYRSSVLGPFWIAITTTIQIATLGFLYPKIFGIDGYEYVSWLTVSLICWQFISTCITNSCSVFVAGKNLYLNQNIPYSYFNFKMVVSNLLVFLHQIPIFFLLSYFIGIHLIPSNLIIFLFSVFVICVFTLSFNIILGILCLRFRDIEQIIGNLMNIAFLMTPVIWMPSMLQDKAQFIKLNPFYYVLHILRAPLLNQTISFQEWTITFFMLIVSIFVALILFSTNRHRIAYW